jgi:hypothetical protein
MRYRTYYLLGAPIAIVLSAAIAYGIVFLVPKLTGYDYIETFTPFRSKTGTEYGYSYDYSVLDIQDLTKLQPEEFQGFIQGIFDSLVELSEAQLYMLNSIDDVCHSTLIFCRGVPSKVVKPFVEKALAYKQTSETRRLAAGGLMTSRWSVAIAIAAFLVSVVGLFVKRKA